MRIREKLGADPADFISPQMNIVHFMKRCAASPCSFLPSLSAFVSVGYEMVSVSLSVSSRRANSK